MTPAKVAREVPGVLQNVSENVSERVQATNVSIPNVTAPNVSSVLNPIETIVGYKIVKVN